MAERSIDERIRDKAYELWTAEGQPHGRDEAHWEQAREIVATQDSQRATLLPRTAGAGEPEEPAIAFENQGEFPTLTDQGEAEPGPSRRATRRTTRSATNPGESVATSLPEEPAGAPEPTGATGTAKPPKSGKAKSAAPSDGAFKSAASKSAASKGGASTSAAPKIGSSSASAGVVSGSEGRPDRPKRGRPPKISTSNIH